MHDALKAMLAAEGAKIGPILCCSSDPRHKPWAGMLTEALVRYSADAAATPFVGDRADDLKAAFHAGCKRVLVRTGRGRKTLEDGQPSYVQPVSVHDDLAAAVDAGLAGNL